MIGKLVRAFVVGTAATVGAVLLLRSLEEKEEPPKLLASGEIDADALDDEERDAMLAELEAQL